MAVTITHPFVSAIADGADATVVRPSNWNATHSLSGTVNVANGGTGLSAGTSGGVLAFTATGTIASSAALAASALVIGGGAGVAPSTTTTATGALTFLGTPTSANFAALLTDETGTGLNVFATAPTLSNPTVTAYLETAPAIANSGATRTLILSGGTVLSYTLDNNCTFTMPTATSGTSFIVKLIQNGTGGRTATFTGVKYPGGTAPTITTTATTGTDIISFVCINSIWYGNAAQAFA
jgi:hypothetical protein